MKTRIKHIALAIAGLGAVATAIPASAAPYQPINQRQYNIDARIDQGVRSGALTRNEAGRLRAQFRDLTRLEYRYRASGGGLSMGERADLNRRFDALSQRVKMQKHDWQYRR